MNDMGVLRTTIAIEAHARRGETHELPDTMVDTGSEYEAETARSGRAGAGRPLRILG